MARRRGEVEWGWALIRRPATVGAGAGFRQAAQAGAGLSKAGSWRGGALALLRQNLAQGSEGARAARARFGSEAAGAARQPAEGDGASDGEPGGDEGVGEVAFRPRFGANERNGAGWS